MKKIIIFVIALVSCLCICNTGCTTGNVSGVDSDTIVEYEYLDGVAFELYGPVRTCIVEKKHGDEYYEFGNDGRLVYFEQMNMDSIDVYRDEDNRLVSINIHDDEFYYKYLYNEDGDLETVVEVVIGNEVVKKYKEYDNDHNVTKIISRSKLLGMDIYTSTNLEYIQFDQWGNWTERIRNCENSEGETWTTIEKRHIEYYYDREPEDND